MVNWCLNCKMVWDTQGNPVKPNFNVRQAEATWCGMCRKKILDEFERQFPRKPTIIRSGRHPRSWNR